MGMNSKIADQRQEAILEAAMQLMNSGGTEAVSMANLASRTGLSRPAIYQYFASREHVLGELVINEMADLSNELERLVKGHEASEQVRIWVHYSLAHLASVEHRVIREISIESLPVDQRGMLRAMHGYLMAVLLSPLSQLGVSDPGSMANMIFGTVASSAKRIDQGSDFTSEAKMLEGYVMAGLQASLAG